MATDLVARGDLDKSASPPGRESREDWQGGPLSRRNGRSPHDEKKRRSRSRSPVRRWKGNSPTREMRYTRDGTNTTSREPHLERARLFVGNIEPNHTHRRDLIKLFSEYGEVLGVSVHRGYAFVQMDRERTANAAINRADNKRFMGAKIHVEFSQAALKAGAKFERLRSPSRSPPPPRDRGPYMPDPYAFDDHQERQREERLARILQMEREISLLRSNQEDGVMGSRKPRPDIPYDSYDRRGDNYRRSPPGPPPSNPSGYDTYSRDREALYRGGGGDRSGGRGFYSRPSPPGEIPRPRTADGPYRNPASFPSQNFGGGGGGGSGAAGTGGSFGRTAPAVGYGGVAGVMGKGNAAPPAWPSGGHEKSVNRPPFANAGPWS